MKRWIAMLLTVCMLFSLCPVGAFAEPATGGTEPAQTVQTEQDTADATGATKGTAAPAEGTPKENADANNAENGNAAANNGAGNAENKENATGTPKENAEASNAGNGNAAANNGAGNAENKENATGATNEEPKAETKTCSCKDLCDMQQPNADCEVCANSNDVGTCCKGSVAKVDAVDPQPAAGEEELVCTTCTTKCTDGHVNDSCEVCKADLSKCRIVEDNQALVDTYEFYVEGIRQDAWTQSLEEGQNLNVPGNPSKEGAVFQGWFRLDGGNKIPVVSGAVSDVSGKTVRVDAVFAEFSYVLFMSKDGSAVVHTAQGSSGNAVSNADLNTAAEMVNLSLGPTEAVVGWSSTQGGEAGAVAFAAGTVKVYPVIKTGYWVIFDSKGGNYVAPVFAQDGQTVTLPTATRPGYTFDGWYQNGQPVTQVNAAANLEAHWTAAKNTKYTVIHWQENANDENYSFKESEPKTGTTGEETKAAAKRYEGFTAQAVTQETIAGDGSTIVNVYYKRNAYTITFYLDNPYYSCGKQEHSHSKWCKRFGCTEEEHTHSSACGYVSQITITAKHGANISDQWPTVDGSSSWRTTRNGSTYQSNIDVMPVGGGSYYGPNKDWGSETAYYYVEVLPGETGTTYHGVTYKEHHRDVSPGTGYSVSKEDKYAITGFTYKEGTENGGRYNNAKFYYTRNSYNIVFINNGTTERTLPLKYEQSLSDVSYEPTRPDGVPAGYEFAGWYDNETGEGKAFEFDGKTMPAQNITLYAKWAAPEVTATVYLTVTVGGESRTLSVPYGSSLVEAPGYEALMQEITAKNGSAPSAWFSVDGDGAKTLFNPDTKLYAPVTLVPHFSGTLETFQVTYVEGDQAGPEDNNSYQSGSYATVLGPKNGNLRFLFWKDTATDKIYKPGESMKMSGNVTLTAVYTEAPATVGLTYHNGTDSRTETNIRANTFATVKSAAELGFTAPAGYVFVGWSSVENGAATYFPKNAVYVPENGAHLYAVWTERTDLSYTVRYLEKGTDNQLSGEVLVSNQTLGASVNAADHKIEITGYKFDSAEPETLEIGAEENVMVLYYVKDTSQTKPTNYTVKHIVGGEEEYSHTYTGTAWINETNPTIVVEAGSLAQKTYIGYRFESMTPSDAEEGKAVKSGTTIVLTYVKDETQTKPTTYTVKHIVGGEEEYSHTYNGTAWINETNPTIVIEAGSLAQKTYTGYKFESIDTEAKEGDAIASGTVITLTYVRDNGQTQKTTYTVQHMVEGETEPRNTDTYEDTAWVNETDPTIIVKAGTLAEKTYTGYKFSAISPSVQEGDAVKTGTVITLTYTKRTDLTYTVKYLWTDGMGSGTAIEGVQDKVVENVTFEQEILEEPIEISGYTPVETGKVERRMDKESLTIVFLYYKNVTLTAASGSVVYNGSTQTLSGYTSSEAEAVFESVTASGSGEDVGEYAVTFSGVSKQEQKISKDGRYLLTGTVDGKLTITPATLTVTTDSDSKVYDGTALTAPGSITGLVNDETVTFEVTGSQTDVGGSKNTYSIDWGNTKSSNYTVAETLGTLNVTAQNITPPVNPDDPNGYLGVQVDSPADHVYDGAEHKWAPTVTDKDGNALTENEDYTVAYGKTDFTNVTGDITVTVRGIGNYTGTVTRSYKITPREAVITVNNGTKTAGQNDPAFTGTVTGLIGENDLGVVSYVRTNNAEAVGTYTGVLTALYTENANYDVRVINGTFVITAANNPNPNPPQPNPNPPQPNPNPPQPQPEPKPEPKPEPQPEPKPQPEPEGTVVEEIVDEATPLDMGGAWALVNLILTILTVLGSILLLIGYIGKKQKEREDENGNVILNAEGEAETDDIKKKGGWRLASIIPAVAAVIAFILTENMRLPMVLVDKWTLLMVIIALVQLLVAYFSKKKTQEPEQPEQMVANA